MSFVIKINRLKKALNTLKPKDDYYNIEGNFINFYANTKLSEIMEKEIPNIFRFITFIVSDFDDLRHLLERINWQFYLWKNSNLVLDSWMAYAKIDIEVFHIKIRSIFDYLAKIIQRVSDSPEQVPDKSFNTLLKWLEKSDDNIKKLGADLSDLFTLSEFFTHVKDVRDGDLHRGGETLVYPNTDRIVFQIYKKGYERIVQIPEIMFNENIVYFDLYAGIYMGYLIAFLEDVSETIIKIIDLPDYGAKPRQSLKELPTMYKWIELAFETVS